MTPRAIITSGALLLLAGIAGSASAQVSRPDHDDKPRPETPKNRPGGLQSRDRNSDRGDPAERAHRRDLWWTHRARSWNDEHRSWGQRGGYKGYHIPDIRFRRGFGRDHWFRITNRPIVIVGGYPRFQYDGYWFSLVDPWPEFWPDDWYETDEVFIDYTDSGYYLYDRAHPNARIAIVVSAD